MALRSLSLCSGVAGLDIGVKLALPSARTVCYVEGEIYAAAVLAARMEEGRLDPAPIWSDLRTFDARAWRGTVDLVTAGFPCQPFSVAGQRKHEADERHLWPEIARIVEECDPALVFLENVNVRSYREPFRDLRRMGFLLSRPFATTAAELGAPILRRRVFALAFRSEIWQQQRRSSRESRQTKTIAREAWSHEPGIPRSSPSTPHRVDRDRALGNAVVPQQAAFAFSSLMFPVTHPRKTPVI